MTKHLILVGMYTGDRAAFDPNRAYTACRLCGHIYQDDDIENRKQWSFAHARTHEAKEHIDLQLSGLWCTPEASQELAAYGIIAVSDMFFSDEINHAMNTAPRLPQKEVECFTS